MSGALAYVTNSSAKDLLSESMINFANSGDNTIIAGTTNQVVLVYRYFLVVGAQVTLTFWDGPSATGNRLTGPITLPANGAMVFAFDTRPWYSCTLGNAFTINASNATQVSGRLYYFQLGGVTLPSANQNNALLAAPGQPIFSVGTTPILVK